MSRLAKPSSWLYTLKEVWNEPKMLLMFVFMILRTILGWGYPKVFNYPSWMSFTGNKIVFNNPEVHFLEQAGGLGITKARDLAKIFSLMIRGDLISKDLVKRFYKPLLQEKDVVLSAPNAKGHGFMYEPHPKKSGKWLFGHPGYGGNNVMIDPEEEIVVAYITNGLKAGGGDMIIPYRLLKNAVFDSLEKFPKENVTDGTLEDAAPPMLN